MYLWDYIQVIRVASIVFITLTIQYKPERDGALENDIVTHENTHGITNRMTGGGTAACLQTTESGGLGEGWPILSSHMTNVLSACRSCRLVRCHGRVRSLFHELVQDGLIRRLNRWTEHSSSAVPDYFLGTYVTNFNLGVRSRAYSTSKYATQNTSH